MTTGVLPPPTAPANHPLVVPDRVANLVASLPPTGLPAYLHDLTALREHAARIRKALPAGVELLYAAKANPEARVLEALAPLVDGIEVSSGGELRHVAVQAPGTPLHFGGPGKTPDELRVAVELGVRRVHVESPHELAVLARLAAAAHRRVEVLLRVNPALGDGATVGAALAMGGVPSPFGMDQTSVREALAVLHSPGPAAYLRLRGLHAHTASGLHADAHADIVAALLCLVRDLETRTGTGSLELNVGGGMSVGYEPGDPPFDWDRWSNRITTLLRQHGPRTLRIEPGRALTAYCGWYATDVLDVKRSHGKAFAVMRGGTHHLRTPAARGHSQPVAPVAAEAAPWPWTHPRPRLGEEPVTLVGQLCTPKDVLARDIALPGLGVGDRVVFGLAGAYAWNISHHEFLMHPQPSFHWLV